MPDRNEVIRNLSIQSQVTEDLEAAWKRALAQRDIDIFDALNMGISERIAATATGLSRSYVNKVRQRYRYASSTAA